ncbi:VAMP-associated protein [Jaminaea rosea]|uniref:VAMP-associated protein n=1 Tax=Jaminaea rosea TaxID=1569628 RepID=A0A316UTL6_9BASI|nr:VAMP-associated protein [Jaminaea rosea]PWN28629.1 VAMP-associated protein [Jaminaea rosea]
MSVDLNPHAQLGFPRPLTQLVKRSLQVSNPNQQPVAFKVKTTAPKQYCVRPNSGRIEPGETVEVQVLLQAMKEEPPMSAKCRDKFLVQSTIITPDRENTQIADLWGLVEQEDKSAIHEQKIRCAFLPPATAPVPEEQEETGDATNGGADDKYQTVRSNPNGSETYNPITAASNAAAKNQDAPVTEKGRAAAAAAGGAAVAGAGAAYAATRSAVVGSGSSAQKNGGGSSTEPASTDGKSSQELQAEINRLRSQVAELKRKNVGGEQGVASDAGVPVHIVAAIAFGVFAVTYLFF